MGVERSSGSVIDRSATEHFNSLEQGERRFTQMRFADGARQLHRELEPWRRQVMDDDEFTGHELEERTPVLVSRAIGATMTDFQAPRGWESNVSKSLRKPSGPQGQLVSGLLLCGH